MARKLNKALVAAVASVAVVGGGAYLAAPRLINLIRPVSKLIAAGDAAAAKGDWATAAVNYGKAASRDGTDIGLQIKMVDALDYTVNGDLDKLRGLRQTEAQILANDPRSAPALRHVLAYQRNDVQRNPADTAAVRALVGTAERLEKIVPGDREARLAQVTAVAEPYSRNLEVRPEDVDKQLAEIDKLVAEKPDDGDALRLAVTLRLTPIQKAIQQADAASIADATTRVTQAMAYVDAATEKAPQCAGAWVARSDVYRIAAYVLGKDTAKRETLAKTYYDSLQKANDLAAPDDAMFLPIRTAALKQAELRDPKVAEAGYRKLLTERPDDRQPRLMLAEFLARQPARRDDAVAVLETPFQPTRPLKAVDSVDQRIYGLIEQVRKTAIRLGALATVTDPAERKKRIDVVESEYRALNSDPDIGTRFKPAVLRVKGGLEVAQGKLSDAINTLDSALKLMNPDSPSGVEQDMRNDTLMEYAQAELRLNQSGEARPALKELVDRRPENLAARAMYADLLINERNFDEAGKQVDFLERVAADSPIVQRMRLRIRAQQGTLKDNYQAMNEDTRDKQFLKLQSAATLDNVAEVERLAKKMIAANPGDADAVTALVQAQLAQDKRDAAAATVAAALQAKPGDSRFTALAANLAARTPEDREQLAKERVGNITDPYTKLLAQGELARAQGKPGDAIESYKAAQKMKPDDARAFEAQFQTAMTARRFADAEAVLGDLARLDADQTGGAIRKVQFAAAKASAEPDADRRTALFKDVAAQAQAVAQGHTELASASLLYAQTLQQTGDLADAIEQYSQTLDKSPTNVDAAIGIADCLLRTDRRNEAHDRVAAAKGLAPGDGRVKELELNYELRFGDPLKAVDTLAAAVNQAPGDSILAGRLGLALEQVASTRQGDEAKSFLARAADVYGKAFARFPQDFRFLAAFAETERRIGQPDVGEQAVEKAVADPANAGHPEVAQLLADTYTRSGKLDKAAAVLGQIINATKPPPVDAVQRLATILARTNHLPDAMAVLDLRKDAAVVQRQRISLMVDSGDVANARPAVETLLADHADADTYLLAAYVELRAGETDKAEGFANKTLSLRPDEVAAMYYRAQIRMGRSPADLDGALADLTKARDLAPTNPDIRTTLADLYNKRGDRDAALNELQQAWNANHANRAVLLKLVDAYANASPPAWSAVDRVFEEGLATPQLAGDFNVLYTQAESYAIRNDAARALSVGRAALALDPKNPVTRQRFLDLLLRAKAYNDVISETSTELAETPDVWWVHRARGIAYQRLGQAADAQKALDRAFELASATADANVISAVARAIADTAGPKAAAARVDPYNDPNLRVLAAEFVRDGGDLPGAIKRLEAITAERDKLPPGTLRRALMDVSMGYLQSVPPSGAKARPVFEELLKATPDDVTLLNNYSYILLLPDSGGTPADALKPAEHAYTLSNATDSGNIGPIIQDTYGWALVKNKRVSDGIDQLRRAAETATFPDVFLHLAEAYLMTNNLEGAEAALNDAKNRLDSAAEQKQPIDPAMAAKHKQLTDDLAKKKAATPGGA